MKITDTTPVPVTRTYTIECNENELKLLHHLTGASTTIDDTKAGVPAGTAYRVYSVIDDARPVS